MQSTKLYCSECGAVNRIPTARLGDQPRCGACKASLFGQVVLDLGQANAAKALQNTELPVLVDCWAPWCGPCKSFAPIFTRVAEELTPRLRFAKLNTEVEAQLAQQWAIRSIPTLILFKSAKEVARMSGALSEPQLQSWIAQHI